MWESVKRFKAGQESRTLWVSRNDEGKRVYTSTLDHESGASVTPNHNPNQSRRSKRREIEDARAEARYREWKG